MQEEYHDVYKRNTRITAVVFLGETGVGKTNMINNYVKGTVAGQPKGPTIGIEYSSKTIPIDAQHTVKAQIWDTAGQEQYRSVTASQLRKALGAFVVFDISSRRTFQAVGYWVRELREKGVENVSILLVGNKTDKNREVAREEAEAWARQQHIPYAETSSADLRSLNNIFVQLCSIIAFGKRNEEETLVKSKSLAVMDKDRQISEDPNAGKSKCC